MDIKFTLVLDDFGVYYTSKEDVEVLIRLLQDKYTITVDWNETKYLVMKIDHNEDKGTMTISVPNYIAKALKRFGIGTLTKRYNTPGRCTGITYGAQVQTTEIDRSESIGEERRKVIE